MMPLLEARDLTKEYKPGAPAVRGVSLSLEAGEFVCVTGRSGSGKSTLFNMVAGVLRPTSGTVVFEGRDIFRLSDREASLLRNSKIGYVSQGANLLANFTVLDNVRLPLFLNGAPGTAPTAPEAATERASALLAKVGISHLAASRPGEISGGETRRAAIARALVGGPSLVVADEPTGDLDPENTEAVMELFAEIARQGTAVLYVTHDPAAATRATRAYRMEQGHIV